MSQSRTRSTAIDTTTAIHTITIPSPIKRSKMVKMILDMSSLPTTTPPPAPTMVTTTNRHSKRKTTISHPITIQAIAAITTKIVSIKT